MLLTTVQAPSGYPLTLDEAKAHCRVSFDDDDSYIDALIAASTGWVESFTRRALITRTLRMRLDGFTHGRRCGWIELPQPPAVSISSVTYIGHDGNVETVDAADYVLEADQDCATIRPAYGVTWPAHRAEPNAVRVEWVAGYGADGASVPAEIVHALRIHLAHLYEHREPVVTGTIVSRVPDSARNLLRPYQVPLL